MAEFGPEFEDSYEETVGERENVDSLQNEYNNAPPEQRAQIEAQLNEARAKMVQSQTAAFENLSESLDVSKEVLGNIDWDKPFEPEYQPKIVSEGQVEEMNKAIDNLRSKFGKAATLVQEQIEEALGESIDPNKPVVDVIENEDGSKEVDPKDKSTWEKIKEQLTSKWSIRIATILLNMLLATGAIIGAWEAFKSTIGCDLAKSDSGCYAIDPKNGKLTKIDYNKVAPLACSDYDQVCGGCNKGYLQRTDCCVKEVDNNPDAHKGWQYTMRCKSPAQAFIDTIDSIGNILNPSNLLPMIGKFAAIVLIVVVTGWILFYGTRYLASKTSSSSDDSKK